MEMIQELNSSGNIYNYDKYVEFCHRDDKPVRPLSQYLHGIGVLLYAVGKYGGDWEDAYIKGELVFTFYDGGLRKAEIRQAFANQRKTENA